MIDEEDDLSLLPGENAVHVVLLQEEGGRIAPVDDDGYIDLADPAAVTSEMVARLLGAAVELVASAEVPDEAVNVLRRFPVPRSFQASAWLRSHRALILRQGRCELDGFVWTYDPDVGLCVDRGGEE